MKFESELVAIGSEIWGYGFYVPNDIAKSLIEKKDRRVICHIEG